MCVTIMGEVHSIERLMKRTIALQVSPIQLSMCVPHFDHV